MSERSTEARALQPSAGSDTNPASAIVQQQQQEAARGAGADRRTAQPQTDGAATTGPARQQNAESGRASVAGDSARLAQQGALPHVELVDTTRQGQQRPADAASAPAQQRPADAPPAQGQQPSGWGEVARQAAAGAVDEVVNHPGRTAANLAIGVGVGVGAALLAPEIAVAAGVVGAAYGAYELYQHIGGWWRSATTVANPQGHSAEEVARAREQVQDLGRGGVDLAAGAVGGGIGTVGTRFVGRAAAAAAESAVVGAESNAVRTAAGRAAQQVERPGAPAQGAPAEAPVPSAQAPRPAETPAGQPPAATESQTTISRAGDTHTNAPPAAAEQQSARAPQAPPEQQPARAAQPAEQQQPARAPEGGERTQPRQSERTEQQTPAAERPQGIDHLFSKEQLAAIERERQIQASRPVVQLTDEARGKLTGTLYDELAQGTTAGNHPPRLDIVMGPTGAGKSSNLVEPLAREHGSMVVDSDPIKSRIPGYIDQHDADAVHRESVKIANALLDQAMQDGRNLVLPKIGDNPESMRALIEAAKARGYDVYLHQANLSPEQAAARTYARAFNEHGELSGQWVHPGMAYEKAQGTQRSFEQLIREPGLLTGWTEHNMDVPRGTTPPLTRSSDQQVRPAA